LGQNKEEHRIVCHLAYTAPIFEVPKIVKVSAWMPLHLVCTVLLRLLRQS